MEKINTERLQIIINAIKADNNRRFELIKPLFKTIKKTWRKT